MIRPDKQPTDDIPADLDPRRSPADRLRQPRSWKHDAALAVAAMVVGALTKKSADEERKEAKPDKESAPETPETTAAAETSESAEAEKPEHSEEPKAG